jgi:hypothetical protein
MSNPWQTKESEERIKKFLKEYDALVAKHDVALMGAPQLIPSGERGFNLVGVVVPVDKRQGGVPSPLGETSDEVLK